MSSTSRCGGDRVANGEDSFPKDGLPSRPSHFTPKENEFWTMLLSQLPNDLLRRVDAHQLQSLCESMAQRDNYYALLRERPLDKTVFSHWMRCVQQIARLSPVFGLGPIDRRRMKVVTAEAIDDIDEWENDG